MTAEARLDLYLVRHGNTFAPGEPVVRLGRSEDLPLVESGVAQAHAVAEGLRRADIRPDAVFASPLRRASAFARIVAGKLSFPGTVVIDDRLTELDYGRWAGLTDEAIADMYGQDELDAWNRRCDWPSLANWGEDEASVRARVGNFADEMVLRHGGAGSVLAVSSAGTLRYFLALDSSAFSDRRANDGLKIGTGHIAHLRHDGQGWTVMGWNIAPAALPRAPAGSSG